MEEFHRRGRIEKVKALAIFVVAMFTSGIIIGLVRNTPRIDAAIMVALVAVLGGYVFLSVIRRRR